MTHLRNHNATRRPGRGSQHPANPASEPGAASDPDFAARAAFAAGEAALRAGQTLNAGRWLRLSKTLLRLGSDLEAHLRDQTSAAAAGPGADLGGVGLNAENIAFERACHADAMAIVHAREAGEPEPVSNYVEAAEDADFYLRLRAAMRAGLFDEAAFQRGDLDLDELDLDAWLPPACRRAAAAD
tara:strand:+ start:823 stop:1377 length:555 start_codon:yes stop_codon:yes gene_type:complete